jgi:hypothetical protein
MKAGEGFKRPILLVDTAPTLNSESPTGNSRKAFFSWVLNMLEPGQAGNGAAKTAGFE